MGPEKNVVIEVIGEGIADIGSEKSQTAGLGNRADTAP